MDLDKISDVDLRAKIRAIKGDHNLIRPLQPEPPYHLASSKMPFKEKLRLVQRYISSLEYNHTGEVYFSTRKCRGFANVTAIARDIVREALPIQCVEATFVGAYLTCGMRELDRYPVSFKSVLEGHVFRHIVLVVRCGGKWGAIGLSRRDSLAYKELKYESLTALIAEYRRAYTACWHELQTVYVGLPLPNVVSSNAPVKWKVFRAAVGSAHQWEVAQETINGYAAGSIRLLETFTVTGRLPPSEFLTYTNGCSDDEPDPEDTDPSNQHDKTCDTLGTTIHTDTDKSSPVVSRSAAAPVTPIRAGRKITRDGSRNSLLLSPTRPADTSPSKAISPPSVVVTLTRNESTHGQTDNCSGEQGKVLRPVSRIERQASGLLRRPFLGA